MLFKTQINIGAPNQATAEILAKIPDFVSPSISPQLLEHLHHHESAVQALVQAGENAILLYSTGKAVQVGEQIGIEITLFVDSSTNT